MELTETNIKKLFLEHLEKGKISELKNIAEDYAPVDIAEQIEELPTEKIWQILQCFEIHTAGEVMGYFDIDLEVQLAEDIPNESLAPLISSMLSDEGADLLSELSIPLQNSLIPLLAKAKREQLLHLSSYENGTCGALMTADYVSVPPDVTAKSALKRIQIEASKKEFIYYVYVIDKSHKLIGVASIKYLILAHPMKRIDEIMFTDPYIVKSDDDQEKAIDLIENYDFMAVPVVSVDDKLVGIITHDDMFDALQQEHTEDMEMIMGISGEHESEKYIKHSPWQHFKNRIPWVAALSVFQLLTGFVISLFEGTLNSLIILIIYMPQMAATGGNAGSQSSTVIIRAISTQELSTGVFFKAIMKEFNTSILMGLSLAGIAFVKVWILSGSAILPAGITLWRIASLVALALGVQVVTAMTLGAILPILAVKAKLDPAIVASPALTTVVDVSGMLIYFGLARIMIGI